MLNLEYARDLVMTGVIFGFATFVWAGWAQERPPAGVVWRIVLAALSVAGLVLVGLGIPIAIRNWNTPTALASGSPALVWYIVVFWLEVAAMVGLAIFYARTKRTHLVAPTVLLIVGVHFVPLAFVFGQPIIMLAAVLLTVAGIVALVMPRTAAASSFWCAVMAAPVLLVLGTVCLIGGASALAG